MYKSLLIVLTSGLLLTSTLLAQELDTINLYFDINKHTLTNEHIKSLNKLLDRKDAIDIQIYGFADFLGKSEENYILSENRCKTIKNYLIAQGIDSSKIAIWSGKGVYEGSSFEKRKNANDPGIKEHRKVEVIYGKFANAIAKKEKTTPQKEPEKTQETTIPIFTNFTPEEWEVGNNIVLENILFYGGTPNFMPSSMEALRHLLNVMKNNPNMIIEIQGHICCENKNKDGYDTVYKDYNLSTNRARAVYHYLLQNGIDNERMTYTGFGAKNKRFPKEKNEEERSKNRRVEIAIISK